MKFLKNTIFALLCCGVLANLEIQPQAGNIGLVLNTTSTEHILQTAIPLACYFALNNKTINLNIEEKSLLYKLTLKSVHLNTVDIGSPVFEQVPGTDKIHVNLSGINIDSIIDGEVDALGFITFKAQFVKINKASFDMVLQSTSDDNVHWKLVETTSMTFESINITLTNSFLNKIAGWFKDTINKVVKKFLPEVTKLIDDKINQINQMVVDQTEYTWDFGLLSQHYPLNMTMTMAPQLVKDSNLIKFNIDGTFHKESGHLKPYSHDYFPTIKDTHREQLWIH